MTKKLTHLLPLVFACLLLPAAVSAIPLTIDSTPKETGGPFLHNVFHSASSNGGSSGTILAWFDLDGSQVSSYDPVTGALALHVNLYSTSGLSTQIGTATGISSNLAASNFDGTTGGTVGTIDWSINLTSSGTFATYLGGTGLHNETVTYLDFVYSTSSAGYAANSWANPVLTLWGANGTPLDPSSNKNFSGSNLGTDVVFKTGSPIPSLPETQVPEPGSLLLLASGLFGSAAWRRRLRA